MAASSQHRTDDDFDDLSYDANAANWQSSQPGLHFAGAAMNVEFEQQEIAFSFTLQKTPAETGMPLDLDDSQSPQRHQQSAWAQSSHHQQSYHHGGLPTTYIDSFNQRLANPPLAASAYASSGGLPSAEGHYRNLSSYAEPWNPNAPADQAPPANHMAHYSADTNQSLHPPPPSSSHLSDPRSAHSDGPHYCEPCSRSFSTKKALGRHRRETRIHQQPGTQAYVCRCGKDDVRLDNFVKRHLENCKHLATHRLDAFHICKCGHIDQDASSMRDHMHNCPSRRPPGRPSTHASA